MQRPLAAPGLTAYLAILLSSIRLRRTTPVPTQAWRPAVGTFTFALSHGAYHLGRRYLGPRKVFWFLILSWTAHLRISV